MSHQSPNRPHVTPTFALSRFALPPAPPHPPRAPRTHLPARTAYTQLAADVGKSCAELSSPSGAVISPTMAHAFAWKSYRVLIVDGETPSVVLDSAPEPMPDLPPGISSPSLSRQNSKLGQGKVDMKYVVITGGVVSGLG